MLIGWDGDPLRGRASRGFAGADEVGEVPEGLPGCWGGTRLGPGFVCAVGCFGFIGRWAPWPGDLDWLGGLGGQEQDSQQGPGCGNAAGDEAADGQAAQECVGGRVLAP